jgi:signal transduction histidine kinase
MTPLVPTALALIIGAALGALGMAAKYRPQLAAKDAELAVQRNHLEVSAKAEAELAEMRSAASVLRHDLRGILSPALLSADRLSNSEDAAVRKAADIVIRCVERASARLSDKVPAHEESKSVLG